MIQTHKKGKNISLILLLFLLIGNSNAVGKRGNLVNVDIWSGRASITNGEMRVEYSSRPLQLTVKRGDQPVLETSSSNFLSLDLGGESKALQGTDTIHRLIQGFRAELMGPGRIKVGLQVTLDEAGELHININPVADSVQGIVVNLQQTGREHYYGLGDVWYTPHVDLKGSMVEMWDQTGTPDECNYVPFYMSTTGYGLFIDSSYPGKIDFGKTNPNKTSLNFEAPSLSMHLWTGDSMKDILPQYLDLTGYPPMPPEWTFLPQKWRDAGTWEDVFEDVNMMQEHDMPLGAVWLDRPWMQGGYGSDDFVFDEERYPDPKQHIKKLHDMDIRLIVWGCDFLTKDSEYYQEGVENDYFVGGFGPHNEGVEEGLQRHLIDFANPEAREWFKGIIKNALEMGVDGIKLDRGQNYPVNVTPPSGRDPKAMHNYHAYLMNKTYAEALQEVRGDNYQFTPRAGWAGTQAWTMKWPGDMESTFDGNSGLPAVVRAQSSAGLTGFAFWGSDIGGYGEELSKEVFVRWLEHGTFSPLMQTPGKGNHNDVPFSWDDETITIYKFYAQLRKNLVPYITGQARIAHKEGIPIVRHLEMHWWHGVHFALWDRLDLLDKSMDWYKKVQPEARGTAEWQGYEGVRWQKMTGPAGRKSPSSVGEFLVWQQPHIIYFAELFYRQHPTNKTLERFRDRVFATADFMASFATLDESDGKYHLEPPLIPAQEIFHAGTTRDPPFELAYWHYGLKMAQQWRKRLGLPPNEDWQKVLDNLAPLPVKNGLYLPDAHTPNAYTDDQYRHDHPIVTGTFGMLPNTGMVDTTVMERTFEEVMQKWDWPSTWGWDYPMLAMCAARLGKPEAAVNALLMDVQKNTYLKNGHNYQNSRLRLYLPGNGGLLTAVAMMATGWDGAPDRNAPGFPDNGRWKIRWEGLHTIP